MKYASHNNTYKKLIYLAREMGAPEPEKIFARSGIDVSKSQLQRWRVGPDHRHFQPISEQSVLDYLDGLIDYVKTEGVGNGECESE